MSTTFDESNVNRHFGKFAPGDGGRDDAGQVVQEELDFGDFEFEPEAPRRRAEDDRAIQIDERGVQHWPDGAEQEPMF